MVLYQPISWMEKLILLSVSRGLPALSLPGSWRATWDSRALSGAGCKLICYDVFVGVQHVKTMFSASNKKTKNAIQRLKHQGKMSPAQFDLFFLLTKHSVENP